MASSIFEKHGPEYRDMGYAPIPVRGKIPVTDAWERAATNDEALQAMSAQAAEKGCRNPGVGLVCGNFMFAVDIDSDDPRLLAALPATPMRKRGSKGATFFFQADTATIDGRKSWDHPVELLGTGNQTVVPPSIHPDTKQPYAWAEGSGLVKAEDLPVHDPETLFSQLVGVCEKFGIMRPKKTRVVEGQVVEASAPARNVAINDYAYALASAGKQPPEIAAAVVEWDADRHEDHADGPWFSDKKEPHRGHPGKAARVADDIAKRAVTKATRRGDALPAESLQVPKPSSSEVTAGGAQSGGASYGQLADDFLKDCGLTHGKTSLLKKYQGDYYVFDTDHYVMIDEEDVKARIVRYLRKRSDTKHTVKTSTLPNVMTNLMDATHVDTHVQLPSRNGKAFNKIPFRNGWVSLEDALEGRKVEPEPHSPEIFSLWCLPFDYSPLTSCPTWDRVLKTSLRNDAMMDCLEEWVGLHFLPPALRMGEQMFALFVGDGANGKSVISCVMRTLFGESNVSAVPLESFRAEGFMMIHMFGKVANIVDEVSDHDASNEEILKKYTAGGVIQANRKNQKAIDFKPSAPLTFSCNTPPRFRDTSGAVKRRLLPFPFNHVIPKKEQDKRLTTAEFWINSGELPGIFARCMTALKRQQERGFTPSPVMQAMIEVLDDINNPTHVWLRDHFEMGEADYPVLVYALHARYLASDVGKKSQTMFNMDVKKVFPGADQTKNANKMYHVIGRDPVRSRVWVGLRERK